MEHECVHHVNHLTMEHAHSHNTGITIQMVEVYHVHIQMVVHIQTVEVHIRQHHHAVDKFICCIQ